MKPGRIFLPVLLLKFLALFKKYMFQICFNNFLYYWYLTPQPPQVGVKKKMNFKVPPRGFRGEILEGIYFLRALFI